MIFTRQIHNRAAIAGRSSYCNTSHRGWVGGGLSAPRLVSDLHVRRVNAVGQPSTSGRGQPSVDRHPPSPEACGTPGPGGSGSEPSNARSSIAGRSRWRRRTVRTCHRSALPGTHHTSGRPEHTAWPPPEISEKLGETRNGCGLVVVFI